MKTFLIETAKTVWFAFIFALVIAIMFYILGCIGSYHADTQQVIFYTATMPDVQFYG